MEKHYQSMAKMKQPFTVVLLGSGSADLQLARDGQMLEVLFGDCVDTYCP